MDDLLQLLRETLNSQELVEAETPLLSSGLVDSFEVVGLLSAIESRFDVVIDPGEIDVETFDTPRQIFDRVTREEAI